MLAFIKYRLYVSWRFTRRNIIVQKTCYWLSKARIYGYWIVEQGFEAKVIEKSLRLIMSDFF